MYITLRHFLGMYVHVYPPAKQNAHLIIEKQLHTSTNRC